MEQGLRLLIQLVLEFAPAIASLIEKRSSQATTAITNPEYLNVNADNPSINYLPGFEPEKITNQPLAFYQQDTLLEIATQERETALNLPEVYKILDNWPLRLYPEQILAARTNHTRTPLKIFIAPPKVQFDKFNHQVNHQEGEILDLEIMLAEGLREFLNNYYPLNSKLRPTEFLAGAWDTKVFHSESSIKALFLVLKSEPILILESEIDGDYLNFRIGYWGIEQENYYYKTISRLPLKEIIYHSAKSRASQWKKIRDELLELGENLEDINKLGGDNVTNLAILEKLEKWQDKGIDVSKLSFEYQVNRQDFEKLCQVLISCHCLVAGWMADVYHLVHHDVPPLLPELLPSCLKDNLDLQSLQAIASGYKQVYQALETKRRYWIPKLALQLAQSLSYLPDRTWAKEQVNYSINTWLQLRQVSQLQDNPLQAMQSAVKIEDEEYIEKLREYFAAIGDIYSITHVEEILSAIALLKHQRQQEYAYLCHTKNEHSGKVTSVAISPDGETLVSGSADKTIKVWNLNSGKLIRSLNGNSGEISSVAVSSNGNVFAVGICDTPRSNVKVWDLKTGNLIHTLLGHNKPVNVVAISPDGKILASGSNKIKIWNLQKGDRISTLWHSSSVNAVAISPDGTILISGTSDHKIRLWNPRTGDPIRTLSGHSGEVKSTVLSFDGEILVSGSADKTIKIWHLETGKVLHTLTGHLDQVTSVVISPNGELLVSASADKTIKIWRLQTGELLQTLSGHSDAVNSVAISSDNRFIVSGSSDNTIKIWQIA